ncbi:OprO/OprP family phosphate-selective porin [Algoriphagus litoralis]|uniref:OprO/OprP family phosphate-selective porin n=1 Tax=Algoriphagus litoralis TaxID=2202829 RepID=UPI000DB9EF0F|nr:porin [Algoriphagus litoralis]
MRVFMLLSLLGFLFLTPGYGQDFLNLNDTTLVERNQAPTAADPVMAKKWNQINTKFFNLNFGLAFLLDHNVASQNTNSISQVGEIGPSTEFRGQRFMVSGNLLFFKHPWRYMVSANYNGMDAPQDGKSFSFIDWNFEIPFGKKGGWITIGKQKEGVGHEYVAPGTQLFFTERGTAVPAFVRQRNIGIRYSNSILQQRATYTVGLFNNYWETGKSFRENGSQMVLRVTGLPAYTSDSELLHVGIGWRYTGATEGKLSYKAKPEVNTAPSFLNTESLLATSANTLMLETIKVSGPFSFVAEYMANFINGSDSRNQTLNYWQVGGSWFITGESRKYNRNNGNLGKLIPNRNFTLLKKGGGPGAFEVGARYTHSDFSLPTIDGGQHGRLTAALSWYPNAHFRYVVSYGSSKLDKESIRGNTNFWQFRAQFEL